MCVPSSEIRVGTWNVEDARGAEKNQRRLDLLVCQATDVWVLTETHDDLGCQRASRPFTRSSGT